MISRELSVFALAQQKLGDTAAAIASLEKAVSLDTDFAAARNQLGLFYLAQARDSEAEKQFNDAIKSVDGGIIPGAVAFKLYDTFGLALDEQEDMARERRQVRSGSKADMRRERWPR